MTLALDRRGVLHGDLVLERRRHQDVDVEFEQLLVVDAARRRGSRRRLVLLRVVEQLRDVEPVLVVDATLPVGDRDDLRADLRQQVRRDRADVAEALDGATARP